MLRTRTRMRGMFVASPAQPQFSPASLFSGGEQGAWYDASDFSTMFQDSAGTTPVTTVGQPVGKILDKSGRGNHATQATAASRPLLQQDGNGKYYLQCDGVDDFITMPVLSIAQPFASVSGVAPGVASGGGNFWRADNANSVFYQNGGKYTIYGGAVLSSTVSTAVNVPVVSTQSFNNTTSLLRVNGIEKAGAAGSLPLVAGTSISLPYANTLLSARLYGQIFISRTLTAGEIASAEAYLAGKTGVTLP